MPESANRHERWKQDFPVPSDEDSYATRREFTKFLGLTSVAFFVGTFAAAARKLWKHRASLSSADAGTMVAAVDEIPAGGSKLFRYPTEDDACILLRLAPDRFVAFSQNCTHLNCPVHFESSTAQLVCPCHHGFFSAEDGRAVAGPPRRSLTTHMVSVRDGQVWVRADSASNGERENA